MPISDINFRNIRKHRNSQNDGFEELTRQLVIADPPANSLAIENRGPGADGGVEILVKLKDGRVWGWQSKYFLDSFGNSEVAQLKESFKAALENFSTLDRYFVAIPRNLSGHAEGKTQTQTKYWSDFKNWCAVEAAKLGRAVSIELWDDSYFVSKLQRSDAIYTGMRLYWFDSQAFDDDWFRRQLEKSLHYIGKRYRPSDHVEVGISDTVRVLRRADDFYERIKSVKMKIASGRTKLKNIEKAINSSGPLAEHIASLDTDLEKITSALETSQLGDLYSHQLSETLEKIVAIRRNSLAFHAISDAMHEQIEEVDPKTQEKKFKHLYSGSVRENIGRFSSAIGEASSKFSATEIKLIENPCLIVDGEAGVGKSHLLANEVEKHLNAGNVALFVPARVLDRGDRPEQEILLYLDIGDVRFETFLAAIHSAGLASGKPALLVIDAINESLVARGWESGLPALIAQIQHFSNIAFCVSVRTSYRQLCIREGINVPRISHRGFRGQLGEAAKEYLDRNGIERPSAPIFGLNEILYNPLFLSTAVDFMKIKGLSSFPRGLDSIATLMSFWLGVVEQNLVTKGFDRISMNDGKLMQVMHVLASAMATAGSENIDYEQANGLCEQIIGLAPPAKQADRLLQRLIDEGMLLDFPNYKSGTGKHVSFGFQRFSDFFIADAIIRDCKTPAELAIELKEQGKFGYLFSEERFHEFAGPRIALLALAPSRFGKELPYLEENFSEQVQISVDEFISSLSWRQASSISSETVELLERLRKRKNGNEDLIDNDRWFSLLVELAPLPDCLINASYLKGNLASLTLGIRDATWSLYLVGKTEVYEDDWSVIQQLIDWAWVGPKTAIEPEMIHQVAIALSLMTSTMDRELRDCATKALSSLLTKFPDEISKIIDEFANWDDSYVRERVLASASAGVLYCDDTKVLQDAALAADRMVFQKTLVERHAWTRRYAQIIVTHAALNGAAVDNGATSRCKPPYTSGPILEWPTLEQIAPQHESAQAIFSSVVGFVNSPFDGKRPMMAGNFGRYTMGGIDNSFSEVVRSGAAPLTREQEIKNFWNKVSDLGKSQITLKNKLIASSKEAEALERAGFLSAIRVWDKDSSPAEIESETTQSELDSKLETAEKNFLDSLPPDLREHYELLKPLEYRARGISTFSLLQGQCWVFQRAVQLGWEQSLHKEIEKSRLRHSYGRHDHQIERIGKKYQHIAYAELVGYLADYHWYLDWNHKPSILAQLEDFDRADIDPTYFSGTFSKPVQRYLPEALILPEMIFVPESALSNMAWAKTLDDIPDPKSFLVQSDALGQNWCLLHSFSRSLDYMKSFDTSDPIRGAQYSIEMILVEQNELHKLDKLTTEKIRRNEGDVFESGWSSHEMLGQRSYRHLPKNQLIQLSSRAADFKFARATLSYSPKYSEMDQSGVSDEKSFSTPHPALLSQLKLAPKDGWSGFFVTEDGSIALCDSPAFLGGTAVVRRDLIEKFAEDNDLKIVWRVWVEKDGGQGTNHHSADHGQFARHDFIGFFFQEADKWHGQLIPFRE